MGINFEGCWNRRGYRVIFVTTLIPAREVEVQVFGGKDAEPDPDDSFCQQCRRGSEPARGVDCQRKQYQQLQSRQARMAEGASYEGCRSRRSLRRGRCDRSF